MKQILYFFTLLLLFFTISCGNYSNHDLVLIKVSEMGSAKISDSSIVKLIHDKLNRDIHIKYTLYEDTALRMLRDGRGDLAVIPNNTENCGDSKELRTIMPLLPRILVILTNHIPETRNISVQDLFKNHKIVFEEMSHLDSVFFKTFFTSFGIDPMKINTFLVHKIDLNKWHDSSFVYVGLTHLHNPVMRGLINSGALFFPLDDVSTLDKGSSVEGLRMDYTKLYPFILPKDFYNGKPEEAVLTIAIPDILVTCSSMNKDLVYNIIKTIRENKAALVRDDNIYNLLNTNPADIEFSYPLHQGAQNYKDRDKPSIWTKYAAIIWPFVSMLAILIGAIASVRQRIKQRKKIRIETLYNSLLQLRKRAYTSQDSDIARLLEEMRDIRSRAFDALMENKLSANESFSIFLSLYSEVHNELVKMKESKYKHQ